MSPGQLLFLVFLIVPFLEIYLLIEVGGVIGALPTILLTVFTAILGAALVRMQGISTLMRMQQSAASGQLPARELFDGACLLIAGALLLTPGFFTDTIGFLLLTPPFRTVLIGFFGHRIVAGVQRRHGGGDPQAGPTIIEGEYTREDRSRIDRNQ